MADRDAPWNLTELPLDRFDMDLSFEANNNAMVVRAWDLQVQREVACKYWIDPALLVGDESEMSDAAADAMRATRHYNLLREARLLAMVDHPNVMPLLEVGRFGKHVTVIILPFLAGGSAAERTFEGPWTNVLDVALQIGRGLAALHDAGILHRDLKPSNILFDDAGRPRISDLGLSCRIDDRSEMLERVGTIAYMPPGVFERGFEDVRDDLWAYCMVVFEMFYGRPPFDTQQDRDRGRVARVKRKDGMSRELHAILVRGLAPRREDRWPDMSVLLQKMEHVRRANHGRWAAVSAALAASFAVGLWMDVAEAKADTCEKVMRELPAIWDHRLHDELRGAFGTRKVGDGLRR